MITLAPPCTMPEENLSQPQQSALTSLVLGKTVTEAASEAGVHRNTVHRWLKEDEQFQASRRHLQHDAQRAVEAKLHDTAMAAMECIEECLEQGDAYVAEQLLKGLGCYSGELSSLGSDDAAELAQAALRHSQIAEMLGGAKAESGERKAAGENLQPGATVGPALAGQSETVSTPNDTEGENLQHDAPSNGRSRHSVPDNVAASQSESLKPTVPPVVEWSPGVGWTDNVDPAFNDNDRWLIGRTAQVQPLAPFGAKAESGEQKAAQAEGEDVQPSATVGPALAGQFDTESATDNENTESKNPQPSAAPPMGSGSAKQAAPTQLSGQGRTYEESNVQQAAPSENELHPRYQSVFDRPKQLASQGERLQPIAPFGAKAESGEQGATIVASSEVGSRKSAQAEGERGDGDGPQQPATREKQTETDSQREAEDLLAPTSDLRNPTLNVQPPATSEDSWEIEFDTYEDLTDQQTMVLFTLQTGDTIDQAAEVAELDRATVYRWLREDHTFGAAMNRCGRERRRMIQARLQQLASLSADVVNRKIRLGNGRLAVRLLKGLGYLAGRK